MKIAHITTVDLSLRGLLLNQLLSIRAAGHEVVGISSDGPDVAAIEAAGIRHIAVPMTRNMTPFADLLALWRLYRTIRRERFDVVHTHNPKPGLLGQLAARLAGVPMVVNTVHGFYFHEHMRPLVRRFYIAMEKIAAWCSDAILSQNREDIETGVVEKIFSREKVKHLGNGIDLSFFDPVRVSNEQRRRLRAELGIPDGAKVVGFVGRLAARRKGFLDFVRAGREIAEREPGVRFLVVGEADHGKPDAVEPSVARDFDIFERCHFLGKRDNTELPALYSLMDVLVLPSLFEGIPRVIMEASAMGVPAVATDVKGNREAVIDGRTGLLVPLGDVASLCDAVLMILRDAERTAQMRGQARHVALERFDERAVFEKVKAEYARLSRKPRATLYRRFGKRALDLALTLPTLLVLLPLLALLALLVRVKLGTPVLFRQQRPGLSGRPFMMAKFRTMTDACDAAGELLPDAERLTSFGWLLRRTSLDELPELLHVLRGEMSLVGPRPLLMRYLERYSPEQARRHDVRPGITGWAQAGGRNSLTWEEKFALDVRYVDACSLWLDLKILAMTVRAVFRREGVNASAYESSPEFMGNVVGAQAPSEEA